MIRKWRCWWGGGTWLLETEPVVSTTVSCSLTSLSTCSQNLMTQKGWFLHNSTTCWHVPALSPTGFLQLFLPSPDCFLNPLSCWYLLIHLLMPSEGLTFPQAQTALALRDCNLPSVLCPMPPTLTKVSLGYLFFSFFFFTLFFFVYLFF